MRGRLVNEGAKDPREVGSHGLSPFLQQLRYIDAKNVWLVPIGHAPLFGAVKDFWDAMLAKRCR